jgi:arsenate reductase
MADPPSNGLFLSKSNTARLVLAESILRKDSGGWFKICRAGIQPKGPVLKVPEGYLEGNTA